MQLISLYDKFSPAIRDVRNNPCPVSTLPIELLQEIFAFSMTMKPSLRIRSSVPMDERKPPVFQATALILTWVCSQWRHIALSMPELWGTMSIYTPKSYCVQLVKLYLSRSGEDTPLDLHLRQGDSVDNSVYHYPEKVPEHKVTADILKLWVPQAHRWRSISLAMTYTAPVHELPKITPGALSRVQEASLQFKFSWGSNDRVIQWLWANIFQSPALRIAYWHDLSKLPTAPFSQLSEFGPLHPKTDEFLTSLPSFQGLRRLTVGVISKRVSHKMTLLDSPVILPYLEYLNLCIGQEAPGVLDEISAPVLRELKIVDRRDAAFAEVHSLEQFLARSECTLRSLRLTQRRVKTETPIIEYFTRASHHLTALETCSLIVSDTSFSEGVISLFTPRTINNFTLVPFPRLVDLELRTLAAKDGMLSSMVESRSAAGTPLWAFVCMVEYGPMNSTGYSKDEAALQKLMQDGLHVFWDVMDEY